MVAVWCVYEYLVLKRKAGGEKIRLARHKTQKGSGEGRSRVDERQEEPRVTARPRNNPGAGVSRNGTGGNKGSAFEILRAKIPS